MRLRHVVPAVLATALGAAYLIRRYGLRGSAKVAVGDCESVPTVHHSESLSSAGAAIRLLPEPTSVETVRRRIDDVFPAGYMTALAIIQGIALGVLLSNIQAQWLAHALALDRVMIGLQAAGVFAAIVVVTHRYTLVAVMVRRIPTVFDALIPFTLGVGEIWPGQLLGRIAAWWAGVLTFSISAIGVYLHSRARTPKEMFDPRTSYYEQFRRITTRAIVLLAVLGAFSAAMIFLNFGGFQSKLLYAFSPVVFLLTPIGVEISGHYNFDLNKTSANPATTSQLRWRRFHF